MNTKERMNRGPMIIDIIKPISAEANKSSRLYTIQSSGI